MGCMCPIPGTRYRVHPVRGISWGTPWSFHFFPVPLSSFLSYSLLVVRTITLIRGHMVRSSPTPPYYDGGTRYVRALQLYPGKDSAISSLADSRRIVSTHATIGALDSWCHFWEIKLHTYVQAGLSNTTEIYSPAKVFSSQTELIRPWNFAHTSSMSAYVTWPNNVFFCLRDFSSVKIIWEVWTSLGQICSLGKKRKRPGQASDGHIEHVFAKNQGLLSLKKTAWTIERK